MRNGIQRGEAFSKMQQFKMHLTSRKLNHPVVIVLLSLLTFCIATGIALLGAKAAILFIIAIIFLPLAYTILFYPVAGISIAIIVSYLLLFFEKFTDFPVGTVMDGIVGLLIAGFFFKKKYSISWQVFKNPVSVLVLIWIAYNLLEVFNPAADSRLAWLYTIRTVAWILVTHFIFLFHIHSGQQIRQLLKLWLCLSFFAAIYGLNQEFSGFFSFEQRWLDKNPTAVSLYFIDGSWRKFSIFSDPVTFSYNMVTAALLAFALASGPLKFIKKAMLAIIALTCLFAMVFSGTRAAFVMIPAGLVLLMLLKFNRQVLIVGLGCLIIIAGLLLAPTSNKTIQRFQSAFSPDEDASFTIRKNNQKKIQPYIQSHPIGGGLGATGTWGQRFSPNSMLANFPPDSGYVRVAVETGWIGLLLLCTLVFVVLRAGINNYYAIRDKRLKSYCLAMILVVFGLHIGNYPQEALVQYPTNLLFSLAMTLVLSTRLIDEKTKNDKQ